MKEPATWKDILANKSTALTSEIQKDAAGHEWQVVSSTGGKKFKIRRVEGYSMAETYNKPIIRRYKCNKCGIFATERPNECTGIVPDYQIHRSLSCDEIIIKDIIE